MESDLVPVRDYMDDETIQWRTKKPNYKLVNAKYMKEKTNNHAAGSLAKMVENIVKTWEMETTHKKRAEVNLHYMSQCMIFPTIWYVRPAKPQISLRICAV